MNDLQKIGNGPANSRTGSPLIRIRPIAWMLGGAWSLIVLSSLVWNVYQVRQGTLDLGRSQARVAYEKDVIYRRWNAGHGGVFVPATDKSPPNPYLDTTERDITTPRGKKLTKMNPAYMTRQIHELAARDLGIQGHITSLDPIRPGNAPDAWEAGALAAFQKGATEVSSVESADGRPTLRLMRPLATEAGCLKCHAAQGYKIGDIRGGISVSLPMAPLLAIERPQIIALSLGHGFLWLIGLAALHFGTRRLLHHVLDRYRAEAALTQSEEKLRRVVDSSPMGIHMYKMDPEGRLIFTGANVSADTILGIENRQFIGKPLEEAFPSLIDTDLPEHYERVCREGGLWQTEKINYRDDRIQGAFEAHAFQTAPGELAVLFTDITHRKRAEETVRERERLQGVIEMAGAVSHEMNQPLMVITGYAELMLMDMSPDDPMYKRITKIVDQVEKLGEITRNFSRITKYETREYLQSKIIDLGKSSKEPSRKPV